MGDTKNGAWKRKLAQVMRWPLVAPVMNFGIRLLVPRRRVGVALVAINGEQQVFMLHHVFHPFAPWGLPGGWMDRKESPKNCIRREIQEETGLKATIGPVVHVAQEPHTGHLTIFYLGHLQSGPISLSSEIIEAAWFDPHDLPEPLYPSTHQAIEKGLQLHSIWRSELEMVI